MSCGYTFSLQFLKQFIFSLRLFAITLYQQYCSSQLKCLLKQQKGRIADFSTSPATSYPYIQLSRAMKKKKKKTTAQFTVFDSFQSQQFYDLRVKRSATKQRPNLERRYWNSNELQILNLLLSTVRLNGEQKLNQIVSFLI